MFLTRPLTLVADAIGCPNHEPRVARYCNCSAEVSESLTHSDSTIGGISWYPATPILAML